MKKKSITLWVIFIIIINLIIYSILHYYYKKDYWFNKNNINKEYSIKSYLPLLTDFKIEIGENKTDKVNWEIFNNKSYLNYKTIIEKAVIENNINFAGIYTIIIIPCGTECHHLMYINRQTGEIMDTNITTELLPEYYASSSLIILNPRDKIKEIYGDTPPKYIETKYYNLIDNKLSPIKVN